MENKNKRLFNKITFFWLLGILLSVTTMHIGIHTQKYNVARLGAFGIVATVPFGTKIFLPSENEIRNSRRRSKGR